MKLPYGQDKSTPRLSLENFLSVYWVCDVFAHLQYVRISLIEPFNDVELSRTWYMSYLLERSILCPTLRIVAISGATIDLNPILLRMLHPRKTLDPTITGITYRVASDLDHSLRMIRIAADLLVIHLAESLVEKTNPWNLFSSYMGWVGPCSVVFSLNRNFSLLSEVLFRVFLPDFMCCSSIDHVKHVPSYSAAAPGKKSDGKIYPIPRIIY